MQLRPTSISSISAITQKKDRCNSKSVSFFTKVKRRLASCLSRIKHLGFEQLLMILFVKTKFKKNFQEKHKTNTQVVSLEPHLRSLPTLNSKFPRFEVPEIIGAELRWFRDLMFLALIPTRWRTSALIGAVSELMSFAFFWISAVQKLKIQRW